MHSITLRAVSAACISAVLFAACDSSRTLDPAAGDESRDLVLSRSSAQVQAPSSVQATAASASQIDVTWQDNSTNETSFQVHRSTTGVTGAFSLLASVTATSHSDTGLVPASEYCYKVRSARSTGNKTSYSPFSNTACAVTLNAAPPPPPPQPPPASPTVTNATPHNSNTLFVDFVDNATNANGFHIYRSFDGGTTWTKWGTTSDHSILYDQSLISEQQVCYRLVAYNAGGESAPSNPACSTPPAAPSNVTLQLSADGLAMELRWDDNSAVEDGYEVRYAQRVNADGFLCGGDPMNADCYIYEEVVAVLGPTSTSYRLPEYFSGGSYVVYRKSDGGFSTGTSAWLVQP